MRCIHVRTDMLFITRQPYFPMQNRPKISCISSSSVRRPVTSSSAPERQLQVGGHELFRQRAAALAKGRGRVIDMLEGALASSTRWRWLVTSTCSSAVAVAAEAPRNARRHSPPCPLPVCADTATASCGERVAGRPGRRQVGLRRDDDRTHAARSRHDGAIGVCNRPRPIDRDDHHVGLVDRLPARGARPPARPRRRSVRRPAVSTSSTSASPSTSRAVTRSRVVPGVAETIARSAPASALNRLDFPAFGAPAIDHRDALAHHVARATPAARGAHAARECRRAPIPRRRADEVIALVGEVHRGLEHHARARGCRRRSPSSADDRDPAELIERRPRLRGRHGVDEIPHRLGLHEIELAVDECAKRELPGPRQPRAQRDGALHERGQHHGLPCAESSSDVFAGVRGRAPRST